MLPLCFMLSDIFNISLDHLVALFVLVRPGCEYKTVYMCICWNVPDSTISILHILERNKSSLPGVDTLIILAPSLRYHALCLSSTPSPSFRRTWCFRAVVSYFVSTKDSDVSTSISQPSLMIQQS